MVVDKCKLKHNLNANKKVINTANINNIAKILPCSDILRCNLVFIDISNPQLKLNQKFKMPTKSERNMVIFLSLLDILSFFVCNSQ